MNLPEIIQDSSGNDYAEGLKERMFTLAASLSSPTIVEIGTRTGNSLRIWAKAIEGHSGQLYSIDAAWEDLSPEGMPWNIPAPCVLIISSSHWVHWSRPIDLLYIDGEHTKDSCQRDLDKFWPWVKPQGHTLVHDITNLGHYQELIPVVTQFCRAHSMTFEVWPNQCGMAHFQKPS